MKLFFSDLLTNNFTFDMGTSLKNEINFRLIFFYNFMSYLQIY